MVVPRVIPRAEHPISRRDIDPDALKVLHRLRQFDHLAYLVGGSVRDLFLGRRPKDFDIGTSAHPYQVKKLFRNCWVIGRRFRLAHVRFGPKVIEVATFRRQIAPGEEIVQDGVPAPNPSTAEGEHLLHHDNTFGTPEEDAFRRDFTINALFYDISTFGIIDYVGGLDDLRAGVVRSIGDPEVRFVEDPVRMLRAVALASRLDFTIDEPVLAAIRKLRHEIARSSPPRMLEEYYKILRSGFAEKTFRRLADLGLLEPISAELHHGVNDRVWRSLANLDAYRSRFASLPDSLSNPILIGSLIVPLEIALPEPDRTLKEDGRRSERRRAPGLKLGELPLARRDIARLRQTLALQRRLRDQSANPRARRALTHRQIFAEALTWLDVHAGVPDLVEEWKALLAADPPPASAGAQTDAGGEARPFRRRRRRRRRNYGRATEG
jgi:poly(A) polymerase